MDVLPDKALAAGLGVADSYMPMDTNAVDIGYSIIGTTQLNENQTAHFGHEFHRYTLDNWWPPLTGSIAMEPNTFWNINRGQRDRLALKEACDAVGVGESVMRRWVKQVRGERNGNTPSSGQALTLEHQRIQALEAQVKRLEMEKEILKKATALLMLDTLRSY